MAPRTAPARPARLVVGLLVPVAVAVLLLGACSSSDDAAGAPGTTTGATAAVEDGATTTTDPVPSAPAPVDVALDPIEPACPVASVPTDLTTFSTATEVGDAVIPGSRALPPPARPSASPAWLIIGGQGVARVDTAAGEVDLALQAEGCAVHGAAGTAEALALLTCPDPGGFDPLACDATLVDGTTGATTATYRLPAVLGFPTIAYDGERLAVLFPPPFEDLGGPSPLLSVDATTGVGTSIDPFFPCPTGRSDEPIAGTMLVRIRCGGQEVVVDARTGEAVDHVEDDDIEALVEVAAERISTDLGWAEGGATSWAAGPDVVWIAVRRLDAMEAIVARVALDGPEVLDVVPTGLDSSRGGMIGPFLLLADDAGLWYTAGDYGALHHVRADDLPSG